MTAENMATTMTCALVFCVFVVIISTACGKVIKTSSEQRGVELGPRNTAVYQRDSVQLECVSDGLASTNIQWVEYTTGTKNLISSGYELVDTHPNRDRYSLYHPNRRTFNLNIADVNMMDAGYYECEDSNDPASVLAAQLVVLESPPVCTQTYPSDTGSVIEESYHTIECRQNFNSTPGIHPNMTWTGPQPFNFATALSQNIVWAGIGFIANRSMDAQNWVCKTNFTDDLFLGPKRDNSAPSYTYQWSSNPVTVFRGPKNVIVTPIQPSYEIGQTITCYADARPAAKYVWQSLRNSELFPGDTLTITPDMVGYQMVRCSASNYIDEVLYSSDFFIDVYVDPCQTV